LRQALIVKSSYDLCSNQLKVVRDSVFLMSQIIGHMDTLIINKDTTIKHLETNVKVWHEIANEHGARAEYYQDQASKQKKQKIFSIIIGSVATLLSIMFF
jgi:thymidylate synthase